MKKLDSDLQTHFTAPHCFSLQVTGVWTSKPQDCNLSTASKAIHTHSGNAGSPGTGWIWAPIGTVEVNKGNKEKTFFQAEFHATLKMAPATEVPPYILGVSFPQKQLCKMGTVIPILPVKIMMHKDAKYIIKSKWWTE